MDLVIQNGLVVDVDAERVVPADVVVSGDTVAAVVERGVAGAGSDAGRVGPQTQVIDATGCYVCPGLFDPHLHIESTMLSPLEFAWTAVRHGTTTVVVDPHEIANVCGRKGVQLFLDQADLAPIDILVAAPSCVPATNMEDAGAAITLEDIRELIADRRVCGLGEMMNFPGIVHGFGDARAKVDLAWDAGKNVDGHCPMVSGADLRTYITNGRNDGVIRISSDHESTRGEEALEKIRDGMTVAVREGSASRDLERLLTYLLQNGTPADFEHVMFCSDDIDPAELLEDGHLDRIIRRAARILVETAGLSREQAVIRALRLASRNAARHYGRYYASVNAPAPGVVAPGKRANLLVLDSLLEFRVRTTIVGGRVVFDHNELPDTVPAFDYTPFTRSMNIGRALTPADFAIPAPQGRTEVDVRCIRAIEFSVLTGAETLRVQVRDGQLHADPAQDLAKLAVFERHHATGKRAAGFVRGLGLRRGALACTVAHDSHNLIVVGVDDSEMADLANAVIRMGGGMAVLSSHGIELLPLPIAGLMSDRPIAEFVTALERLDQAVHKLGCSHPSPFMALSFLALPVIPELKMTNRGLVDVNRFQFVDLVAG